MSSRQRGNVGLPLIPMGPDGTPYNPSLKSWLPGSTVGTVMSIITSPAVRHPTLQLSFPNSEQTAAVLGFGYQLALNRMGKSCVCDVLPRLRREEVVP